MVHGGSWLLLVVLGGSLWFLVFFHWFFVLPWRSVWFLGIFLIILLVISSSWWCCVVLCVSWWSLLVLCGSLCFFGSS